jgi:serine/threonine protein kinase/Flp pilus assembly protein TadD
MTTWNPHANELFLKALELPSAEERQAFLDRACASDAALRAEVEALLEASARAGSFLESPARDLRPTVDEPIRDRPGTVIGPYKLLEQIGEGGFGVVFMAEQHAPIRRKVALKVVKPGMDTRQVIARFEAERQALALMDHSHIAKVLDAGETATGRPYFVMELVYGIPITQFCDQNQFTPRERLELFAAVCQAIQHAHQKGVIHRDVKPSNVLVTLLDGTPVVKVIDFGVAKAIGQQLTDKTLFTGFAQMIGTPLYMSPEQAAISGADVDTRSDIYSLGVLLYELLTGTTPFDRERLKELGFDELRRIIREEEPPRPSTRLSTLGQAATTVSAQRKTDPKRLSQLCRGELDWIVMKALDKDRNRRYESASAFAADVQRYLHDEPVLACPPSRWYQLRKFARRRRAVLAIAACVLVALAGIGGGVGWAVRDRAAHEEDIERREGTRRAEIDREVSRALAEARLLGDRAKAKPLEDGSPFREALAAAHKGEELARASGASGELRQQAADLCAELEREAEAAACDRRFLARLLDVRGPREGPKFTRGHRGTMMALPEPTADEQFAAAFRDWGLDVDATPVAGAAARLKRRPTAVVTEVVAALDEWASERRRQGKAPAQWQRLADLAAALDDQPDSRRRELRALLTRGNLPLERALGEVSQALLPLPALTGVVPWPDRNRLRQLAQETDATKEPVLGLLTLTRALQVGGDDATAERLLREAVWARPKEVVLHYALGRLLEQQRPPRWGQAVECYTAARALRPELGLALAQALVKAGRGKDGLALFKRLVAEKPDNPWLHYWRGYALDDLGRSSEAEKAFREAVRLQPDFPKAHGMLGAVLGDQRHYKESEKAIREAIRLLPNYPEAHYNLGVLLRLQGKHKEAEEAIREAIRRKHNFPEAHTSLGLALGEQRRYPEAEQAHREAIRLKPDYALAHNNLGVVLNARGKHKDAEAALREAIRLDRDDPDAYFNLGIALNAQGKYLEAATAYREVIRRRPDDAEAYNQLGAVLHDGLRQYQEAEKAFRAAIRQASLLDRNFPMAHYNLGIALDSQGRHKEAAAAFREAIRLKPNDPKAHNRLGIVLNWQGKHKEAEQACREAIRLGHDYPETHFNLGIALGAQGKPKDAEEAYRTAIRFKPDYAEAHCNLGWVLRRQGRLSDSLAAYQRGHELGSKQPDWRYPSAVWVREAEQLAALDAKLQKVLQGEAKPAGAAECLQLAKLCQNYKKRYAAAVRLYAEAFAAEPKLADNLRTQDRYHAACAAALAGCGQGEDAAKLDEKERARLRQQALDWLRADLTTWGRLLKKEPDQARAAAQQTLRHWQRNADFAGVRGDALAKLPEAEREPWQQLWADVEETLSQASPEKAKDTDKKPSN